MFLVPEFKTEKTPNGFNRHQRCASIFSVDIYHKFALFGRTSHPLVESGSRSSKMDPNRDSAPWILVFVCTPMACLSIAVIAAGEIMRMVLGTGLMLGCS